MSKAVMLSIRPEWCEKIASGRKTVEVRKTRPRSETPFKCYIYCTEECNIGERLWILTVEARKTMNVTVPARMFGAACVGGANKGNGKVIGEFVCDKIYELAPINHAPDSMEQQSCLTREEIVRYINGIGYGWHISEPKIYDTPKELSEFKSWVKPFTWDFPEPITRPPQSWRYVEELT